MVQPLDDSGNSAVRPKLLATAVAVPLLITATIISCTFFMSQPQHDASIIINYLSNITNSTTSIINNHPADHDALIPLQTSDIVGFLCAALGLIIAAGGGIGGGGLLVPIYILILGFLPKHAIPLSNVT